MILVIGATGNAGSQVVRALQERGLPIRGFVRDAQRAHARLGEDVELAIGDLADAASVRAALEDVDQLALSCADDPRRVEWERSAIDAAAAAGVRSIVRLSTIGAEPGAPVSFWDWHGRVDEHLRASGMDATILQSSFYMSNVLAAAEQIAAGRLFAPAGNATIAMIDPRDVGASAAAVLAGSEREGRTYVLTGPQAISYWDVASGLSTALGRTVEFVDVPEEVARRGLDEAGVPEFVVDQMMAIFAMLRQGVAANVTDSVEELTRTRPRSFSSFARDHASLFEPASSVSPG